MAKRATRSQARRAQLNEAASVRVPATCDVAVVGGGAAGLVAAICAAEAGASAVVFDRDLSCGRTILATGNGRCNFANECLDHARYNDPAFVETVCGDAWLEDVLGFFAASGLRWSVEEGRLYPLSRQAASVRNVLLARARAAGVTLAPAREVHAISFEGTPTVCFSELFEPERLQNCRAACVVIACGGVRLPVLGINTLQVRALEPVLCPLACAASPLVALDGRRARVHASLTAQGAETPWFCELGEALFRSYGLSGIVTFDLSRRASAGDLVTLDLAPEIAASELRRLVQTDARGCVAPGCLDGVLDPAIAHVLEGLARDRWDIAWPGRPSPASDAEALVALVKGLPFIVEGPAEPAHAQVLRGGLATSQFDPTTLAHRGEPRLYACGEALDVDGDCGGFNLAWAWKSGMVAGAAAGRHARP